MSDVYSVVDKALVEGSLLTARSDANRTRSIRFAGRHIRFEPLGATAHTLAEAFELAVIAYKNYTDKSPREPFERRSQAFQHYEIPGSLKGENALDSWVMRDVENSFQARYVDGHVELGVMRGKQMVMEPEVARSFEIAYQGMNKRPESEFPRYGNDRPQSLRHTLDLGGITLIGSAIE